MKSLSGTPEAWPARLVVISGTLLAAVGVQLVAGVVGGLQQPSLAGPWVAYAPLARTANLQPTPMASTAADIHARLAAATGWAGPLAGMMLLAAVVLVSHIAGTTDAAGEPRMNHRMTLICQWCVALSTLAAVAAVAGVVTDLWHPGIDGAVAPIPWGTLGMHVVGVLFAVVAAWLGLGSVAELRRLRTGPASPGRR